MPPTPPPAPVLPPMMEAPIFTPVVVNPAPPATALDYRFHNRNSKLFHPHFYVGAGGNAGGGAGDNAGGEERQTGLKTNESGASPFPPPIPTPPQVYVDMFNKQ